jgi:hypothetical protein
VPEATRVIGSSPLIVLEVALVLNLLLLLATTAKPGRFASQDSEKSRRASLKLIIESNFRGMQGRLQLLDIARSDDGRRHDEVLRRFIEERDGARR